MSEEGRLGYAVAQEKVNRTGKKKYMIMCGSKSLSQVQKKLLHHRVGVVSHCLCQQNSKHYMLGAPGIAVFGNHSPQAALRELMTGTQQMGTCLTRLTSP